LSDTRICGRDLRLANLLKASKNVSTLKSVTISRWIARLVAHVNRQIYTLDSVLECFTAPVKSIPVMVKGQTHICVSPEVVLDLEWHMASQCVCEKSHNDVVLTYHTV